VQAFARFLAYRDMEPGERSYAKVAGVCGISKQLVDRWGKRWQWTRRTAAYDTWLLELGDALGKRAVLGHRGQAARFGSLALSKASAAVAKLNETKLTVDEAVNLAVNGTKLSRQALQVNDGATVAERAPTQMVAVSFTSPWANQPQQNEAKPLVLAGEQVLGETPGALARTVPTKKVPKLSDRQLQAPGATPGAWKPPARLAERIVAGPKTSTSVGDGK
jgi:hypothetical protein